MSDVKRVASVIRLTAESVDEYERLHAAVWPAVLEQISSSNIRNYSIYRYGLLLFSYFEYVGENMDADVCAACLADRLRCTCLRRHEGTTDPNRRENHGKTKNK